MSEESEYLNLIKELLSNGDCRQTRNGTVYLSSVILYTNGQIFLRLYISI